MKRLSNSTPYVPWFQAGFEVRIATDAYYKDRPEAYRDVITMAIHEVRVRQHVIEYIEVMPRYVLVHCRFSAMTTLFEYDESELVKEAQT